MGKRINTLNTASSPANDDYLPIDGATNGTRKISADFVNNLITDVEVDGTSVVTSGVAEIDLSGKQDTLTAGSNIQIAQDGTISATDTTYTAGTNVQIDNGVISATDTTYTAGTGIDITNGVISSNVTPGSTVSVTQKTSTGTNIADITVDGVTTQLYAPNGGGGGGGSSTLAGLTDVSLSSPTDGQGLIYDSTNGKWENGSVSATASVSTLTDVTLSGVADGQILKYDASSQKWVNANESGGGSFPANWGITTTALTANNVVTGDPWTVANDTDYYDTAVRFIISTAVYQKTNANPALGGVYLVSASGSTWTCGIFVSTDSSAVSYTYNTEPWGSFTYLGRTWYFSGTAYALSGDRHTEVSGVRYIGDFTAYDYDSKECAIEAGKYLIDNAGVKFTSDLFTAMFSPSSGSLFAGGGIKADLTDAPFKVTNRGSIYGSDIIIGGNSLLSTKQDTLTAGNYIDITNDEISVVGNSRYYQGSLVARVTAADSRITASSYSTSYGDYPPWKAFDGTSPTDLRNVGDYCWTAEPDTTNQWIQYHFDSAKYLTKVEISSFSNYSDAWVGTVKVEGSTDGTTFTNILASGTTYTLTAPLQALGTSTINLNKQNSWNYIRITFVEAMGVAYQPSIFVDEIYIYGGDPARNIVSEVDFTKLSNQQVVDLQSAIGGGGKSDITIVSRTDNTNVYAWLIPCDTNGNPLKPSEVTLLSIFAETNVSGVAPPYYNGLNVGVDTNTDSYYCKLYDTQTGNYAPDGIYSVDYTVAYIPNSGGSSGGENARFESTELLSSTISTGGTYTLEDALENYDFVTIVSGASNEEDIRTVAVEDILNTLSDGITVNLIGAADRWVNITACSGTSITIAMNAPYIHSIKGYKLVGGGGSSSHTYSTTEQKVGTWIDGSDVWEKTINIEETTIHADTPFTIDIETNIDALIEHNLMYRDIAFQNGRWNPLDGYTQQINDDMYYNRLYLESNGTLKSYFAGSLGAVTICGVIRYTKVSAS